MLVLIMKIIVTPFAIIEQWCKVLTALLIWDKRPLESELLFDIIWKKKDK